MPLRTGLPAFHRLGGRVSLFLATTDLPPVLPLRSSSGWSCPCHARSLQTQQADCFIRGSAAPVQFIASATLTYGGRDSSSPGLTRIEGAQASPCSRAARVAVETSAATQDNARDRRPVRKTWSESSSCAPTRRSGAGSGGSRLSCEDKRAVTGASRVQNPGEGVENTGVSGTSRCDRVRERPGAPPAARSFTRCGVNAASADRTLKTPPKCPPLRVCAGHLG